MLPLRTVVFAVQLLEAIFPDSQTLKTKNQTGVAMFLTAELVRSSFISLGSRTQDGSGVYRI